MLFPSEMTEIEIVGAYEVVNPVAVRAIAEARRVEKRKRREVAKLGLTMDEAIERALRRHPVRAVGAAASQPHTGRRSG